MGFQSAGGKDRVAERAAEAGGWGVQREGKGERQAENAASPWEFYC